jgi:hypothetical protein
MRALAFLSLTAMLLSANPAQAETALKLTAGTLQLGGIATGSYNAQMGPRLNRSGEIVDDTISGFRLALAPEIGYFVIDKLAVIGGVSYGAGFGKLYRDTAGLVTFFVGARFYMPMGWPVTPYGGLDFGMGFGLPTDDLELSKAMQFQGTVGALLPLNEHVAVDFGLRATYAMSLEDGGVDQFLMPFGYFGLQSFF